MARNGHREAAAGRRSHQHLALRKRHPVDRGGGPDRPEQVHESREVVDADVQDRTSALAEELGRCRMEDLRPTIHERDRAADRVAEATGVDLRPGGLERAAEKRVRRTADPDPGALSGTQDGPGLDPIGGEWLLALDVPAGLDRREADLRMNGNGRDVQDDVDGGVLEQRVEVERPHAGLRRDRLGPRRVGVGARHEAHARVAGQAGEVLARDVAAADHPDPERTRGRTRHWASICLLTASASRMSVAQESNSTISRSTPAADAAAMLPEMSILPSPSATFGSPRRPVPSLRWIDRTRPAMSPIIAFGSTPPQVAQYTSTCQATAGDRRSWSRRWARIPSSSTTSCSWLWTPKVRPNAAARRAASSSTSAVRSSVARSTTSSATSDGVKTRSAPIAATASKLGSRGSLNAGDTPTWAPAIRSPASPAQRRAWAGTSPGTPTVSIAS